MTIKLDQAKAKEISSPSKKLTGIEFQGVMCSATADDMFGLASIKNWVLSGNTTNFHFENGSKLSLSPANFSAFEAVWLPFRASFF